MKKFVMTAGVILAAASPSSVLAQSDPAPQQIVTLAPSGSSTCGPSGFVIDRVIDPADGELSAFVIPPKQVLVLTGGTWSAGPGIPEGAATTLQVFLNPPPEPPFPVPIVLGPSVPASAAGIAAGAFTVRPGIVIRPGAPLCVNIRHDNSQFGPLTIRLYGYLAKDG